MSNCNCIKLIGRLCNDTQAQGNEGAEWLANTVAVRREFKNKDTGEYESDFISIKAFKHNAMYLAKYCAKGDLIAVTGSWQHRQYTDANGNNRYADDCVIESVTRLSPRQEAGAQNQQEASAGNDYDDLDLPF